MSQLTLIEIKLISIQAVMVSSSCDFLWPTRSYVIATNPLAPNPMSTLTPRTQTSGANALTIGMQWVNCIKKINYTAEIYILNLVRRSLCPMHRETRSMPSKKGLHIRRNSKTIRTFLIPDIHHESMQQIVGNSITHAGNAK